MDINKISKSLHVSEWNKVESTTVAGIGFELVVTKKLVVNQATLLVKQLPLFDANTAMAWHNRAQTLNKDFKKKSGMFVAQGFYLCLIADVTMADAVLAIQRDTFGAIISNPGCYVILIVDKAQGVVHEKVIDLPSFSVLVKAFNQLSEIMLSNVA